MTLASLWGRLETCAPIGNRRQAGAGWQPARWIPSFYEKAVLCQAENSSFLTSRNSVPGIPPISVCLGLAGGACKAAPVLGGEPNPSQPPPPGPIHDVRRNARSDALFGFPSFTTLSPSSSHGSDSYTLLLYALWSEPTWWLGARWVSILMSRRCHLPRDLRNAQQVNWDWIKDGNAVAEPGISSVPVVVGPVSLFLKIADPYARFKPDSLGSLSNCGFRERFIDFACHPQLVQQYRQLSR